MSEASARRKALTPRGAILAMVVLGLLFTSVYPLRRYFDVRNEIAALKQEEVALDRQRLELEREKALLRTDEEIEEIARDQLGMVKPGEVPFVVPQSQKPEPLPRVAEPDASPGTPSVFSRWWGSVRSAFHVLR